MRLFLLLILFILPLSSSAMKHYVLQFIEHNKTYTLTEHKHNDEEPFKEREVGQANIWDVKKEAKETFVVHFIPREMCQEVWICSTPFTQFGVDDKQRGYINSTLYFGTKKQPCSDYTIFRPMEESVTVNKRYHNDGDLGKDYRFPWAKAIFKYDPANNGHYKLLVAKEDKDPQGAVSSTESVEVTIKGLPLILASSPYCKVIVQADKKNGRPVDFVRVEEADLSPTVGYPAMKVIVEGKKEFNNLLVPTAVKKYEESKQSRCPPIWKPEFEPISSNWHVKTDRIKTASRYFAYQMKRDENCKEETTEATKRTSFKERTTFKLHVDNPAQCNWVRICFLEPNDKTMCLDPTKSIELMFVYKLFVGIDSDQAKRFDVSAHDLTHIRFEVATFTSTKDETLHRLTMSYAFASDQGGVQHHMFTAGFEDWFKGSQRVTLIRDEGCYARLVTDHLLETDRTDVKQCLSVAKCDVAKVLEFDDFVSSKEMANNVANSNDL